MNNLCQYDYIPKRIVIVTGGFDPFHSGHIAYINAAKELDCDILIAGVNSDEWLVRKKGRSFMPFSERKNIVENCKNVDLCIGFDDSDDTAKDAIIQVRAMYPEDIIIFANGGDRSAMNIPEMELGDSDFNLIFEFAVGGRNKMNSSSWILQEWKSPKTERQWGYYRVLHEVPGMKVKELTVNPKAKLSMQKHAKRSEYWILSSGKCVVFGRERFESGSLTDIDYLTEEHDSYYIPVGQWHQLSNPFDVPCKIVEIQYGEDCIEEDIERKDNWKSIHMYPESIMDLDGSTKN